MSAIKFADVQNLLEDLNRVHSILFELINHRPLVGEVTVREAFNKTYNVIHFLRNIPVIVELRKQGEEEEPEEEEKHEEEEEIPDSLPESEQQEEEEEKKTTKKRNKTKKRKSVPKVQFVSVPNPFLQQHVSVTHFQYSISNFQIQRSMNASFISHTVHNTQRLWHSSTGWNLHTQQGIPQEHSCPATSQEDLQTQADRCTSTTQGRIT